MRRILHRVVAAPFAFAEDGGGSVVRVEPMPADPVRARTEHAAALQQLRLLARVVVDSQALVARAQQHATRSGGLTDADGKLLAAIALAGDALAAHVPLGRRAAAGAPLRVAEVAS